jgi:hypothetical protein
MTDMMIRPGNVSAADLASQIPTNIPGQDALHRVDFDSTVQTVSGRRRQDLRFTLERPSSPPKSMKSDWRTAESRL